MMKILDIMKFMGEMEWVYTQRDIPKVIDYLTSMILDGRLMEIHNNNELFFLLIYSITDFPKPFLEKGSWDYLEHDEKAKTLVIEHLASRKFNHNIFSAIKKVMLSKYPQLETCVWRRYRQPYDKIITIRRDYEKLPS